MRQGLTLRLVMTDEVHIHGYEIVRREENLMVDLAEVFVFIFVVV